MILILLLTASNFSYSDIKPLTFGSFELIKQEYKNKPFILALWSIDCPPCFQELDLLKAKIDQYKNLNVVLISSDDISAIEEIHDALKQHGLEFTENWVFAEGFTEKLRFEIDPNWSGVLPRTYLYNAKHKKIVVEGLLKEELLNEWIKLNIR